MKWLLGLGALAALGVGGAYWYNTMYLPLRITAVAAVGALQHLAYDLPGGMLRDRTERLLAGIVATGAPMLTRPQAQEYNALMRSTGGVIQ
jgi:hypothetical protein